MTEENKYDYFGLRIEKSVSDGATTEVSRYALDGWNPAKLPSPAGRGVGGEGPVGTEGFNVWAKLDGSSSLETRYLYNDDVDHLLARIDHIDTTAVQLWYLQDYQNSTRYVLDQTGTIVDSLRYDGYGNIDVGSELDPSMRGDYAWTGREIDVETGLQYNRARWYDGTTGKWISQDPLGFDAGDSNLYRYVNNAPTDAMDPSGMELIAPDEATAKDYLDWLERTRNPFQGEKGPGLKTVSIKEMPTGRWVFLYTDASEIKRAVDRVSADADKECLRAMTSITRNLQISWLDKGKTKFDVSTTGFSESEKVFMNANWSQPLYKTSGKIEKVMKMIDDMGGLDAKQKKEVRAQTAILIAGAEFKWTGKVGWDGDCGKWVAKYMENIKDLVPKLVVEVSTVSWTSFGNVGHNAIAIRFNDGHHFYLDDTNVGGASHIFFQEDCKAIWKRRAGPKWFMKEPEK